MTSHTFAHPPPRPQSPWLPVFSCKSAEIKNRRSRHRIKISNRRATQRCNVSSFFHAEICSLLARRRSSQPVQRVYWPANVIDWLGKWRPTCVMRHARGHKASDVSGPSIWIFILWSRCRLMEHVTLRNENTMP